MTTKYTYFSVLSDESNGLIDLSSNVKCLLVGEDFVLDQMTHNRLSDITGEVTGIGYTEGGNSVTVTFNPVIDLDEDPPIKTLEIIFQPVFFNIITLDTKGAVYYIDKGSAADSVLYAYLDFGNTLSFYGNNLEIESQILKKNIT